MSTYIRDEKNNVVIAKLSADDWELPSQVKVLEKWLDENSNLLVSGEYRADIGFSMRENACGGGAVLSVKAMTIMSSLGMRLFLSEYPDD